METSSWIHKSLLQQRKIGIGGPLQRIKCVPALLYDLCCIYSNPQLLNRCLSNAKVFVCLMGGEDKCQSFFPLLEVVIGGKGLSSTALKASFISSG